MVWYVKVDQKPSKINFCVNPQASKSAHAFMARVAKMDVLLCPCCRHGQLHIRAVLAGLKRRQRRPTRWRPPAGDLHGRSAMQPISSSLQGASNAPEAVLRLAALRPAGIGWRNGWQ